MTNDDPLARYDQAWTLLERVLSTVGPDQWSNQTPCTEWDVHALVNHLVNSNLMVSAMARGEEPPPPADTLGDDPIRTLRSTTAQTRQDLDRPGLFEQITTTPIGEAPGVVLAMVRIVDMFVHAWDIAAATGQSTDLDPELTEYVAEFTKGLTDRPEGGPFGPMVEPSAGASQADRLAAFLGRRVPA